MRPYQTSSVTEFSHVFQFRQVAAVPQRWFMCSCVPSGDLEHGLPKQVYLYRTGPRPGKRATTKLFMVRRTFSERSLERSKNHGELGYLLLPQSCPDTVALSSKSDSRGARPFCLVNYIIKYVLFNNMDMLLILMYVLFICGTMYCYVYIYIYI